MRRWLRRQLLTLLREEHEALCLLQIQLHTVQKRVKTMGEQFNQIEALLAEQSTLIAEISSDIDALIAQLGGGGLDAAQTAQVLTELQQKNDALKTAAAKYTPPAAP